ncbi:hypothetical protein [Nocardia sp. NPDC057668]|uniref:hypothetical protein n=1 Tax=Nocardia sp. NPDC057668 TaxID=3346202 RepID=UPI0036710543
MSDTNEEGDAVIEEKDVTAARPPMPALPPNPEGPQADSAPDPAAGWAQWLDAGHAPDAHGEARARTSAELYLAAEDPMAPLVSAARERAAITRRHKVIRDRIALSGVAVVAFAVLAAALWFQFKPEESTAAPAAVPVTESVTPVVDRPGSQSWCRETNTPDQVSGSGLGDLTTGPGVILRLEHAWYVQRDAAVVRALLTPDALAAPEQATRDAIAQVPAGTQHCVSVARMNVADRWSVTVDERRPDGSQTSWQQIFTTTVRDGQVRISSIVASGQ